MGAFITPRRNWALLPALLLTGCSSDSGEPVPAAAFWLVVGTCAVLIAFAFVACGWMMKQAREIAEMERVLGREIHRYSRKVIEGVRR